MDTDERMMTRIEIWLIKVPAAPFGSSVISIGSKLGKVFANSSEKVEKLSL